MVIIDYTKKRHKKIIYACVAALKQGKVLAYPTDTCYGLAVDVENAPAIKKLYKVKGRSFNKPVSIIPPSLFAVKKIVSWNKTAEKLAKKFLPGAITLVLSIQYQVLRKKAIQMLSAGTGELGVRMPKNNIALDLAKYLKTPITTTSANTSGKPEFYSAKDLLKQFSKAKFKPDIIINAGQLPKRKPSTIVKIDGNKTEVLREGSISKKQIKFLIPNS
ncbi:MAG: L-threonylcarbamoyladenylate synthase [Patescibacteria group bacterium]